MGTTSTPYAAQNPENVVGLDINCTDGSNPPPTTTELSSDEVEKWFTSHPTGPVAALRLLVLADHQPDSPSSWLTKPHFTEEVITHAIWRPDAYLNLLANRSGGCAALLDDPWCFVLKTPSDDGPACSLALSRRGNVVKGIYSYQSKGHRTPEGADIFNPLAALKRETIQSGWRSTGLQIISLPQAIARAHARYITTELNSALTALSTLEHDINHYNPSSHPTSTADFAPWNHILHQTSTHLLALERRARFQSQLLSAIETLTTTQTHYKNIPHPPLAPLRSQQETWTFDLATLPRRIENARNAITAFTQLRTAQLSLSIARSSREMTEAALRDNATMKTIAILTMVFLPSTAVATFFSMGMFDWSAGAGRGLVTKWVWVFFAVAGPLTGVVLGFWWWWARRYERGIGARFSGREGEVEGGRGVALLHREDRGLEGAEEMLGDCGDGDVEMQEVRANGKYDG